MLQFFSEAHVALDVLDGDRGVIDQNPYGQRKPAKCHQVDCLSQGA